MIHPEQPGKEEVSLPSLSPLAALRRRSSMWSQCKWETSHPQCSRMHFPRNISQDNASQQQVWLKHVWANPATHGPCVIFFISRTQILCTLIASQMRKLQHKKHLDDFLIGDCRATGSSQLFHTPRLGVPAKSFSFFTSEWLRQHGQPFCRGFQENYTLDVYMFLPMRQLRYALWNTCFHRNLRRKAT